MRAPSFTSCGSPKSFKSLGAFRQKKDLNDPKDRKDPTDSLGGLAANPKRLGG